MVFEVLSATLKEITGELFNNFNDFFILILVILYVVIFFAIQYYLIKFYIYLGKKIYDGLVYFNLINIRNNFNNEKDIIKE